jgi:ABC-type uncharacterized transport system permease subunit
VFDTRDIIRVRRILAAYVVVLSLGLVAQAAFHPELWMTWLITWACAVLAPAISADIGARRLRQPQADARVAIRLLVAPMAVSAIMIVTLFEVVGQLSRH